MTRTASEGRRGRVPGPVLAFVLSIVFIFLASLPPILVGQTGPKAGDLASVVGTLYGFVLSWLLLWLWVAKRERRPFVSVGFRGGAAGGTMTGVVIAAVMLALALVPLLVAGKLHFVSGSTAVGAWLAMLVGFFLQGGAEEVVYRGWLLQVLRGRMALWLAMLVQTVAFMIPHVANPDITVMGFLSVAIAGFTFGALRLWSGSLWVPIAAHAVWNWAQAAMFGFNVSGVSTKGWSLLEPRFDTGVSTTISGGENGIEGMLTAVIGLVLITVVLFVLARRRGADITPADALAGDETADTTAREGADRV